MGLDITAYSHLKLLGTHVDVEDWCEDDDHLQAYAYSSFPASFRGIEITSNKGELIMGGCYETTPRTEETRFRAGSYGGYGDWRRDLSHQFNPEEDPDLPFYELIYFADNDGCIGPEAARDLLADFREHREKYLPGERDEYWEKHYRELYDHWTRAFELAAEDGMVRFH